MNKYSAFIYKGSVLSIAINNVVIWDQETSRINKPIFTYEKEFYKPITKLQYEKYLLKTL